jgi:hypothetical protein
MERNTQSFLLGYLIGNNQRTGDNKRTWRQPETVGVFNRGLFSVAGNRQRHVPATIVHSYIAKMISERDGGSLVRLRTAYPRGFTAISPRSHEIT